VVIDGMPEPARVAFVPDKRPDTVGELKSAEVCVSYLPSLKAKKLGKLTQEKAVLEHRSRFANSIRGFYISHEILNVL